MLRGDCVHVCGLGGRNLGEFVLLFVIKRVFMCECERKSVGLCSFPHFCNVACVTVVGKI